MTSMRTDGELLFGFSHNRDETCFAELLQRHGRMVYHTAYSVLGDWAASEDVVQATFVILAKKAGSLSDVRCLASWLHHIALCCARNLRKSEQRRHAREHEANMGDHVQDEVAASAVDPAIVHQAIDDLSDTYRLPIMLHHIEGRSHAEVAESLRISINAVAVRLNRAREELRKRLIKRGVTTSATVVVAMLGQNASAVELPASCIATTLHAAAGAGTLSTTAGVVSAQVLKVLLWQKAMMLAAACLAILTVGGGIVALTLAHQAQVALVPAARTNPAQAVDPPPAPLPYLVSSISGTAIDAKTRLPIAELEVMATGAVKLIALPNQATYDGRPAAVTDMRGCYTVRFMIPSRWAIPVRVYPALGQESRYSSNEVKVYQGEQTSYEPLEVTPFTTLKLSVVDPEGKPVVGAQVRSNGNSRARGEIVYTTDHDGGFTDPYGARSSSWDIFAPGFAATRFAWYKADSPIIRLQRCAPVSGTVVDADGKPVHNIRVYAGPRLHKYRHPNTWWVPVDGQGRFTIPVSQTIGEPVWVYPARDGESGGMLGPAVCVNPGQTGVSLTMYPVGKLAVHVLDQQGKALGGKRIRVQQENPQNNTHSDLPELQSHSSTTGDDGTVIIAGLIAGKSTVTIPSQIAEWWLAGEATESGSVSPTMVDIIAGTTVRATVTYQPIAVAESNKSTDHHIKIVGFLVDEHGHPVLHARIRVGGSLSSDPDGLRRAGDAETAMDGSFEIDTRTYSPQRKSRSHKRKPPGSDEPETAGQLRMFITMDGFNTSTASIAITQDRPQPEQSMDVGRLVVRQAAERTVVLHALRTGGGKFACQIEQCTNDDGKVIPYRTPYREESLLTPPPTMIEIPLALRYDGAVHVLCRDECGSFMMVVVPSTASANAVFDVVFPTPIPIDITVLDDAGKPSNKATFVKPKRENDQRGQRTWTAGADGKIAGHLSPQILGTYWLFKNLAYQPVVGTITANQEPLHETIRLQPADATVSVQVTSDDGRLPPGLRLSLYVSLDGGVFSSYDYDDRSSQETLDADGRFNCRSSSGVYVSASVKGPDGKVLGFSYQHDQKTVSGQTTKLNVRLLPPRESTPNAPADIPDVKPVVPLPDF